MKLHWVLFSAILLLGFCTPIEGLFGSSSLQDYIDGFVDAAKFQINGMLSLNDSTVSRVWSYFKSHYGRAYSSLGLFEMSSFCFPRISFVFFSQTKKNDVLRYFESI